MPFYICRVTSTEVRQREVATDEHGGTTTVATLTILSRFPKEDLRPWGRKLYAFLCVLYLPLLIDLIWSLYYSTDRLGNEATALNSGRRCIQIEKKEVKRVFKSKGRMVFGRLSSMPERQLRKLAKKVEAQGKAELEIGDGTVEILPGMVKISKTDSLGWRVPWVGLIPEHKSEDGLMRKIFHLVCLPVYVVVFLAYLWAVLVHALYALANLLIYPAFASVWNLFLLVIPFAFLDLLGVSYFQSLNVGIRKSTRMNDEEEEMMELALETSCGVTNPETGDKIKVCFGPFEYWCLFRAQMQSDAPATRSLPV